MSLAGLELDLPEIIEQFSRSLDTAVEGLDEMSLAGLRGKLYEMIEEIVEKWAEPGQKNRHVTGRLDSSTPDNDRTMTPASG